MNTYMHVFVSLVTYVFVDLNHTYIHTHTNICIMRLKNLLIFPFTFSRLFITLHLTTGVHVHYTFNARISRQNPQQQLYTLCTLGRSP
jgi:hypothetical protein